MSNKETDMPAESIVVTALVIAFFTFFSVVLAWASRNASPTFPETAPQRSDARVGHGGTLAAGAH